MNLKDGDTIAAIATATGKAGIGVVRISGRAAPHIAAQITQTKLEARKAHYRRFSDAQGQVIDEGVAILYRAPASFTGEDVLELQAHGSPLVLDLILERVLQLGARVAQPGEFSLRAFLNNKYDLVQLEAIADLINSASRRAAHSAQRALQGEMSAKFAKIAEGIKALRIRVEAELDFSDEETGSFNYHEFTHTVQDLIDETRHFKKAALHSVYLYEGAQVAIVGSINVGKSSLLNALAKREEAIVSKQPGTTRDIVSRELIVDDIPIRFLDTAGMRETEDLVEQEGMRRSWQAMKTADLCLLVVDVRHGIGEIERTLLKQSESKAILVAANKIDLLKAPVDNAQIDVYISAKTGEGIDELKRRVKERIIHSDTLEAEADLVFANRRHLAAMNAVDKALSEIAIQDAPNSKLELVAENLRVAQQALEHITGAYHNEELLGDIFSRFCIGK